MANGQLYVPKSPRNQQQHEAVPQLGTATRNTPDHEQTQSTLKRRHALSIPISPKTSKFSPIGTQITAKMKIYLTRLRSFSVGSPIPT
jgi:hypothetical protein